jgi:hypothetical protein
MGRKINKMNMPINIETLLSGSAIEESNLENHRMEYYNYPKEDIKIIYCWVPKFKYQKVVREV